MLATETAGADKKVLWDIGTWLAAFDIRWHEEIFSSYSVAMTTVVSVVAPVSTLPECGCEVQDESPADFDGPRRDCEVGTDE